MKDFIMKMVEDYNEYSELVALNYMHRDKGECGEGILQWNKGHLSQIREYLLQLEGMDGVNLEWKCKEHVSEYDGLKRQLEYTTVRVIFDD